MKDMMEILKKARKKKVFHGNEFEKLLMKIQAADSGLEMDWDDDAGEEWARFFSKEKGTVCMASAKIGLAFISKGYDDRKIRNAIDKLEIVFTENYSKEEWKIDLDELKQTVPEICWRASEDAVDTNGFSLDDLYFATV